MKPNEAVASVLDFPKAKPRESCKRTWNGLTLPRGVFERKAGSNVLWVRYGRGNGRMRREVAGKYIPGILTPAKVLRDAVAILELRRTEKRQGKHFPGRKKVSFDVIAADALAHSQKHKPRSLENDEQRMKVLLEVFKGRCANDLTAHDIRQALEAEEAKRKWSPATVNNYRLLLSMTYRVALDAGKVQSNPALGVKLRKLNNERQRCLSADEEQRLRDTLAREYPEHVCEFNVMYYSGLRHGDVYGRHGKRYKSEGLDWSNVSLDKHMVTIPLDKNGKAKHVPLSPEAEAALRILGERSGYKGRVVVDGTGKPIQKIGKWYWRMLRLAGIKDFHIHDLRHNLASILVNNEVSIYAVQKVLGHQSLKSTMRYSHLDNETAVAAASVLGRIRPATGTKTDTTL